MAHSNANPLLQPLKIGGLELPNRIIMAPLTRMRAAPDGTPSDLMVDYYRQRATAGLIVAEATSIAPGGYGVPNMPGIHEAKHIAGWKKVTAAVHLEGGRIFLQIVHAGRASHSTLSEGKLPVAPSAIAAQGGTYSPEYQQVAYETPRALKKAEIPGFVELFRQAAENALEAGFDGVEIHGANGYLVDEFLQDVSNKRTDSYGGSFENRARFVLEVLDSVRKTIGGDRLGLRLSPQSDYNSMNDSDPKALFAYLISQVNERDLAYLHMLEGRASEVGMVDNIRPNIESNAEIFRRLFKGPFISAGGYTPLNSLQTIKSGNADAVAFGRMFIANPDLVERTRSGSPLNTHDRSTFYGGGAVGYTDYPELPTPASTV